MCLELTYERSLKLIPPQSLSALDAVSDFGGAVGNVYDYVNVGAMVRFGFNLPDDYGPLRIEPGLRDEFLQIDRRFQRLCLRGRRRTRAGAQHLPRRQHLAGQPFGGEENLVGDLELGAAVTVAHARLAFTTSSVRASTARRRRQTSSAR